MYPSPLLNQLKSDMFPNIDNASIDSLMFWLFWTGLYIPPLEGQKTASQAPLYGLLVLLIIEKMSQRWLKNRCELSLKKIKDFKVLEEQLHYIESKDTSRKYPYKIKKLPSLQIPAVESTASFITIGEAK